MEQRQKGRLRRAHASPCGPCTSRGHATATATAAIARGGCNCWSWQSDASLLCNVPCNLLPVFCCRKHNAPLHQLLLGGRAGAGRGGGREEACCCCCSGMLTPAGSGCRRGQLLLCICCGAGRRTCGSGCSRCRCHCGYPCPCMCSRPCTLRQADKGCSCFSLLVGDSKGRSHTKRAGRRAIRGLRCQEALCAEKGITAAGAVQHDSLKHKHAEWAFLTACSGLIIKAGDEGRQLTVLNLSLHSQQVAIPLPL